MSYNPIKDSVSMPSAGSSHFYIRRIFMITMVILLVSMPSAGSSHFYEDLFFWMGTDPLGVNALGGLFSFLPLFYGKVKKSRELCVNALGGLFSFLQYDKSGIIESVNMCQCPRRALLISTSE